MYFLCVFAFSEGGTSTPEKTVKTSTSTANKRGASGSPRGSPAPSKKESKYNLTFVAFHSFSLFGSTVICIVDILNVLTFPHNTSLSSKLDISYK